MGRKEQSGKRLRQDNRIDRIMANAFIFVP
jgi:hypothetical protein